MCKLAAHFDRAELGKKFLIQRLLSNQNTTTGGFGNQYSSALAVQALLAAGVEPRIFCYEKAMRNILKYQKKDGSFGTILANIQVTPALLGESLINLKNYPCPAEQSAIVPKTVIAVRVQLIFNVPNLTKTEPWVEVSVLQGSTAKTILDKAKEQNSCYTATYRRYAWGHSITSICGVASNWKAKHYWMIYLNNKSAQYGVDGLKPKDGDYITFKYKKVSFK
ncbi:transcobalamin-2-like [Xenia sp. Carnegie-2017]|uniref:transcobalamin-2-like n=1 Tax=Xenia sp. Carnegie-2017 TaxID=2897299 RepID=UPI001F049E00|nr:transcobalamin-2-like [Xenia sp. Carnegie-2017]